MSSVLLVICVAGCSTPYMIDRGRDAADIFTIGMDYGIGAKARVGPIQTGLIFAAPAGGLRGGQISDGGAGPLVPTQWDLQYIFGGNEVFCRTFITPRPERGKDFEAIGGDIAPFWHHLYYGENTPSPAPYYYSQIEIAVDLLVGVRLGFNPGELLDFLLGWFWVDIYHDDIEVRNRKTELTQIPNIRVRNIETVQPPKEVK